MAADSGTWHHGLIARWFAQEILLLLDEAGFREVAVEGGYTGRPAVPDDPMVVFVARK